MVFEKLTRRNDLEMKKITFALLLALLMSVLCMTAMADSMPSCYHGVYNPALHTVHGPYCTVCHTYHLNNQHVLDMTSGTYTKVGNSYIHSYKCKVCGETISHTASFTYKPVDSATHYAYCSCGDLFSVSLPHSFNDKGACTYCCYTSKPTTAYPYWLCTGCHGWVHVNYHYCPTCKPAPSSLHLNATEVSVTYKEIGTLVKLYAYVDKETCFHIRWSSSNSRVATVSSNGTVKIVGVGEATITAYTDNGLSATCKVKVAMDNKPVVTPVPVTPTIEINKQIVNLSLYNHTEDQLTVKTEGQTGKLVWESSDSSVVKVDQNGNLTAKAAGEATIIVYDEGSLQATCKVIVEAPVVEIYDISSKKAGQMEVKFTSDCKMGAFEVYYRKAGANNWMKKTVKVNAKSGKVVLKQLKNDTEYEVSVRGVFAGTNGKKYKTEMSDIETIIVK